MTDPAAAPLYRQISALILRQIAAGRLIEGERLPPEREMAAEHGISVGTLRKALADLAQEGVIERRHGSGNYIRKVRDIGGLYGFFRLELATGGGWPTARVLSVAALDKPAHLPRLGAATRVNRVRRLRLLDTIPAAYEEIWLDAGYGALDSHDGLDASLYQVYRTQLGLRITRIEDRVGLGAIPDWAEPSQGPKPGTACGHVERLSWDQDGHRAEYSQTWFDPERVRYVSRLQ